MKIKKRTIELTVEKSEKFLVRRRTIVFARCAGCRMSSSNMVSPAAAAAAAGITPRAIYRRVETGQIHFTETNDGQLLICLNSLFQAEEVELRKIYEGVEN